ncbi:MAG: hypothetical protein EYC69_06285 [Bacteroidetes bacterium]|nr:MAG: hypothetical protein EYC69_06285 [Bacteroidota bacterium]
MFQLSNEECLFLISQTVTSKKEKRGGRRKPAMAFTEHGVTMLTSILKSQKAQSPQRFSPKL